MPTDTENRKVKLESVDHAIEVGYAKGKALRDKGALAVEEGTHIEMWGNEHQASPYVMWWKRGFEAGFRGKAKPTAK
jgi:hypothetical protein